jgi:hypothetical protein
MAHLKRPLTARFTHALALVANQDPRLHRLLNELDRAVTALEQETGVVGKWPPRSASVR